MEEVMEGPSKGKRGNRREEGVLYRKMAGIVGANFVVTIFFSKYSSCFECVRSEAGPIS
jgi:hypothetical protein